MFKDYRGHASNSMHAHRNRTYSYLLKKFRRDLFDDGLRLAQYGSRFKNLHTSDLQVKYDTQTGSCTEGYISFAMSVISG